MRFNLSCAMACLMSLTTAGCANVDPTLGGLIKIESGGAPISQLSSDAQKPTEFTYSAASTADREAGCHLVNGLKKTVDVDTLYARAMRNFTFKSPDQIAIYRKTVDRTYLVDRGYKHEKQAGSYYHLAQTVRYELPSGAIRPMFLELRFTKSGAGSDVTAEYCVDPKEASASTRQTIENKIRSALFVG